MAFRYDLDPALIKAIIKVESDFNPSAVSPKGACGLMQLMPGTARELGVTSVFDPDQNIEGGVRHMRRLLDFLGGDLVLSLAAYNAGEIAVLRYGTIPPFEETERFVELVLEYYDRYKMQ